MEDKEVDGPPVIKTLDKGEKFTMQIPICCREGWDSCPHVVKPQRNKKRNIGL